MQRLRDLESKVVIDSLSLSGVAPQFNLLSPKELRLPFVEEPTNADRSDFNTQVLDVTQIPILEEYR